MQYFKHQSNMRHDVKIKRVISKYGLEGYGLYNLIVESITESLSTNSPLPDLQENCEDIAEFYNGNTAKINEMTNYMVNQGLFDIDEITGHIFCSKVYKFLDTSQTRSNQLRQMIRAYKDTQLLLSQNVSDISEDGQDIFDSSQDKNEEENRREQNKKEEKRIKRETEDSDNNSQPFETYTGKDSIPDFDNGESIMDNIENLASKKNVN